MLELKGSLTSIGLPALVQLLGELHESGRLDISGGAATGELWFGEGRLVDAAFGGERGLSALDAIALELADGECAFLEGELAKERSIDATPESVRAHLGELSHGTPYRASVASIASIPSLDAVPHLTNGAVMRHPDHAAPDGGKVDILTLVDGQRSVREIIGSRPLVPALRELAVLAEQGSIELRAADAVARLAPGSRVSPARSADAPSIIACPKLGFADDREHHYSRPTAMHRCYASGVASVVSGPEQRDLCLSGQYAECPRFRRGQNAAPRGVAARLDAVQPTRGVSSNGTNGVAAGTRPAPRAPVAAVAPPPDQNRPKVLPRLTGARATSKINLTLSDDSRRPLRLATAGLLCLAVVLAAVAAYRSVFVPAGPAQQAPVAVPALATTAATPVSARATLVLAVGAASSASEPQASGALSGSAAGAAAAPAEPTPMASAASAASTASAANTADTASTASIETTPAPVATAAPVAAAGQSLVDLRFAAGPPPDWVQNPPFASWSDGAYRMQAADATHFVAVALPQQDTANLGDVVVSATFRKTGGPPGGGYGIIIRDQGPPPRDGSNQEMNAYVLEAGDLGEYGIWRRDGDHWVDLVPWTRDANVHPGGSPNDLDVRAMGSHISFTLNGVQVGEVDDATLATGAVGVFTGGDYNQVALDHLTVQVPD
ncbi:MAG: DUF4388 domain-containing protein [Chloroflexi bacterium]|nr:DUF4388 domain-containing protein [Chloroflexota bacterium]